MENFKPSHFIEQYIGEFTPNQSENTEVARIGLLDKFLQTTKEHRFLRTVAVFKIQYKDIVIEGLV